MALGGALSLFITSGDVAQAATSGPTVPVSESTPVCSDPHLGGQFFCENVNDPGSGEAWWTFPDGTEQVFVIGTDFAVWTRWQNFNGGPWVSWATMHGQATEAPVLFYNEMTQKYYQSAGGIWTPEIVVTGTDAKHWNRHRTSAGAWTPWTQGV